ncbi:type II toxin-antitoxin system death-on-curing family toxin [Gymnodinialimonas sp.]
MSYRLFPAEVVIAIHDAVLNPGELQGFARDKSLEGALARVENRVAFGMIDDAFDLAAAYAEAIGQGHCFNDANKRTAFQVMAVCLHVNGIVMEFTPDDVGPRIIDLAQGRAGAEDMARWLRVVAAQ